MASNGPKQGLCREASTRVPLSYLYILGPFFPQMGSRSLRGPAPQVLPFGCSAVSYATLS